MVKYWEKMFEINFKQLNVFLIFSGFDPFLSGEKQSH